MKLLLYSVLTLTGLSIPVFGQKISNELCERVFDSADKVVTPTHVYRRDSYTHDCKYEYDGNGGQVYVSVELFGNLPAAKEEVNQNR